MLSMRVCRQGMQVTWSMWQPTFKLWEYVGYASNRVYGGGYIQGRHTVAAAGGGESDGSCHNRPSTNSLISRLRFQSENKNYEEVEVLVTKMMTGICICSSCKGI